MANQGTLEYWQDKVDTIKECAGDDEGAHGMEDALRAEFIEYVSTVICTSDEKFKRLQQIARVVLSTKDIEFHRWCA